MSDGSHSAQISRVACPEKCEEFSDCSWAPLQIPAESRIKESLGREGWQRQGGRKRTQAGEQPASQVPRSKVHVRKQA